MFNFYKKYFCNCESYSFGEFKKSFKDNVLYLKLEENGLRWIIAECPKCGTIRMFSYNLSIASPSKLDEYLSKYGVIGKIKKISEVEKELLDILKSKECEYYNKNNNIQLIKYINSKEVMLFHSNMMTDE
ncbi:hypothetical protein NCTC12673_gp149 [Campylobacter phage NCTC12673]|uniref:Uncharacterized protein n=2 Tax=Fletchervirus NCTC12673 TaxID=934027 RepID=A0A1B0XW01_9CAUD|nr:hypothetical protein NCTC12673_gp149 [Campylobacter phage NCTC12673]YP_009321634.1 hypothetical protein BOX06_gp035 [Campylobacter phage PC14]AEA86492.1 hypothetical protein [Campylobacter phage NCTC12673]ANH51328.1 hypothetical protein PC14_00035 [Campylobacter phage PC14]